MKKISLLIFLAIILISCNKNENKSDGYGNFEADEVIVSSESAGQLLEFNVKEGDNKISGDIIGFVDTIPLILQRNQLISQKELVKSKFENVKSQIEVLNQQKNNVIIEQKRVDNLLENKAATQKQKDDILGSINLIDKQINSTLIQNKNIEKELESLTSQENSLNDRIKRCYIRNPSNGIVINRFSERGEIISPGKPLYKIADISEINFKAYLSGIQISNLKLGQKVKILVDLDKQNNKTYEGEVIWISPKAEFTPKIIQTKEERVNLVYPIKIKVKNDGTLKIGMPGEIKL